MNRSEIIYAEQTNRFYGFHDKPIGRGVRSVDEPVREDADTVPVFLLGTKDTEQTKVPSEKELVTRLITTAGYLLAEVISPGPTDTKTFERELEDINSALGPFRVVSQRLQDSPLGKKSIIDPEYSRFTTIPEVVGYFPAKRGSSFTWVKQSGEHIYRLGETPKEASQFGLEAAASALERSQFYNVFSHDYADLLSENREAAWDRYQMFKTIVSIADSDASSGSDPQDPIYIPNNKLREGFLENPELNSQSWNNLQLKLTKRIANLNIGEHKLITYIEQGQDRIELTEQFIHEQQVLARFADKEIPAEEIVLVSRDWHRGGENSFKYLIHELFLGREVGAELDIPPEIDQYNLARIVEESEHIEFTTNGKLRLTRKVSSIITVSGPRSRDIKNYLSGEGEMSLALRCSRELYKKYLQTGDIQFSTQTCRDVEAEIFKQYEDFNSDFETSRWYRSGVYNYIPATEEPGIIISTENLELLRYLIQAPGRVEEYFRALQSDPKAFAETRNSFTKEGKRIPIEKRLKNPLFRRLTEAAIAVFVAKYSR